VFETPCDSNLETKNMDSYKEITNKKKHIPVTVIVILEKVNTFTYLHQGEKDTDSQLTSSVLQIVTNYTKLLTHCLIIAVVEFE
jgi:hypothetical protein